MEKERIEEFIGNVCPRLKAWAERHYADSPMAAGFRAAVDILAAEMCDAGVVDHETRESLECAARQ
jgi:hypothetical protein